MPLENLWVLRGYGEAYDSSDKVAEGLLDRLIRRPKLAPDDEFQALAPFGKPDLRICTRIHEVQALWCRSEYFSVLALAGLSGKGVCAVQRPSD